METNGSISNSHESQHSDASGSADKEKPSEKVVFINHAEIAWQKRRREWVGDKSQKSQRAQPDISDADMTGSQVDTSDSHIGAQIFDTAFQHRSNDYYCRGIRGVGKEKGGSNSSQIYSEMVRLRQEQNARLAAEIAKLAAQNARIIKYQREMDARIIKYQREMDAYNDELIKIQAQQQALSMQWMQDFMMTQSQGLAPPPVPYALPLPEMPRTPPEEQ